MDTGGLLVPAVEPAPVEPEAAEPAPVEPEAAEPEDVEVEALEVPEEALELEVDELPDEATLSEHPEIITAAANVAKIGNRIVIDSTACRTILS